MRPASVVLAFLVGCGGGGRGRSPEQPTGGGGELADVENYVPSYGKPELQKALISERAAEATGERIVTELETKATDPAGDDRLRVAMADLAVRRRFIAALESCEADGRRCPPRLDDPAWTYDYDSDPPTAPPVTASLRFDVESWRALAVELHGRACACRTIACVESVGVAIDRLESKPMPEVQGDDDASHSVTRARECLFWLRGKTRR